MALELPTLVQRFVIDASQARQAEGVIAGSLGRTQRLFSTVGKNLTKFVTLPLLGIGFAAIHSAMAVEDAMGILRARTGATGEALQALEEDFTAVAKVSGQSLTHVAEVMATLRQRTGLTGEALRALSITVLELQRITGETAPSVNDITRLFGQWQIATKNQTSTLDLLFRASQASAVPLNDLVQQVTAFSPALKVAGFDLLHTIGIIAALGKAGINVQQAFFGVRTFLTNAAKAGKDPAQAFAALIQQIEALARAGRKTDAVNLGLKNFGARGIALAQAAAEGRLNVDAFTQAIANSTDTIASAGAETDKFSKFIGQIKNQAQLGLGALGEKLLPSVKIGMTIATAALLGFVHALSSIPAAGPLFGILVAAGPMIFLFSKLLGIFRLVAGGIDALNIRFVAMRIFIAGGNLSISAMAASFGSFLASLLPILIPLGVLMGLLAIMHERTDKAAVSLGDFKKATADLAVSQGHVSVAARAVVAAQAHVNTLVQEGKTHTREYTAALKALRDTEINLGGAQGDFFSKQRTQVIALRDAILAVVRPNLRTQFEGIFSGEPAQKMAQGLQAVIEQARAAGIPLDQLKQTILDIAAGAPGSPGGKTVEELGSLFDTLAGTSNKVTAAQRTLTRVLGGTTIEVAKDEKAWLAQRDILASVIEKSGDYAGTSSGVKSALAEEVRQLASAALGYAQYEASQGRTIDPTKAFIDLLIGLENRFPGLKTQIDAYISAAQHGTPVTGALGTAVAGLGGKLDTAADDAKRLADNIKAAEDAITGALEPSLAFLDAQVALHTSSAALGEALKGAGKSALDTRGNFNLSAKGGTDLASAFTQVTRDAEAYVARAVELGKIRPDQAQALLASKLRDLEKIYPRLAPAIEAYINKLPQMAHQHHLAVVAAAAHAREVRDVLTPALKGLPPKVQTEVTQVLSGLINGTKTDFGKVKTALDAIKNLDPSIRKDILAKLAVELQAHARVHVTVPDVGFHVLPGGGGAVLKADRIALHVLHKGGFLDPRFGEEQLALLSARERVLSPTQNIALEKALASQASRSLAGLAVAGTLRIRSDGKAELLGVVEKEIEANTEHEAALRRMNVR